MGVPDKTLKTDVEYIDNLTRRPMKIKCAGDYCKLDEIELDTNMLPEFHYDKIVKIQTENEKKETAGLAIKSFTPDKSEVMLPNLPELCYKVPNLLILLDQDIRDMWREQVEVNT